jgi:hypothetical protein
MSATSSPITHATLDAVDLAFLRRIARRGPLEPDAVHAAPVSEPAAVVTPAQPVRIAAAAGASMPAKPSIPIIGAVAPPPRAVPAPAAAAVRVVTGTLVERLLAAVPDAWTGLAQRVEERHRGDAVVIAVTGARRGEGRTTIVRCLARVLAARGHAVECVSSPPLEPGLLGGGRPPIVFVDAGVWFPGGPLRRSWIERQSLGCHAVILVRRADQPECPARAAACVAVGLDVVGEVLTMVPPAGGPGLGSEEPTP